MNSFIFHYLLNGRLALSEDRAVEGLAQVGHGILHVVDDFVDIAVQLHICSLEDAAHHGLGQIFDSLELGVVVVIALDFVIHKQLHDVYLHFGRWGKFLAQLMWFCRETLRR